MSSISNHLLLPVSTIPQNELEEEKNCLISCKTYQEMQEEGEGILLLKCGKITRYVDQTYFQEWLNTQPDYKCLNCQRKLPIHQVVKIKINLKAQNEILALENATLAAREFTHIESETQLLEYYQKSELPKLEALCNYYKIAELILLKKCRELETFAQEAVTFQHHDQIYEKYEVLAADLYKTQQKLQETHQKYAIAFNAKASLQKNAKLSTATLWRRSATFLVAGAVTATSLATLYFLGELGQEEQNEDAIDSLYDAATATLKTTALMGLLVTSYTLQSAANPINHLIFRYKTNLNH